MFNIGDFYYTFTDLTDDSDDRIIHKIRQGNDFVYAIYYDAEYYPSPIRFEVVCSKKLDEEGIVNPAAKEGEEILLYDKGIIAKVRESEGDRISSYSAYPKYIQISIYKIPDDSSMTEPLP